VDIRSVQKVAWDNWVHRAVRRRAGRERAPPGGPQRLSGDSHGADRAGAVEVIAARVNDTRTDPGTGCSARNASKEPDPSRWPATGSRPAASA